MQFSENKQITIQSPKDAVLATLAFFGLFQTPIGFEKLHKFLYRQKIEEMELRKLLAVLVSSWQIIRQNDKYSLLSWDENYELVKHNEVVKRFAKIRRYLWLLRLVPFARNFSIINSLALGTADGDSDIDLFVVTKSRTLYFVRTIIILLFKTLGLYKTRTKIKEKFCFGFYVTEDNLSFHDILLPGGDVYFSFWLASMLPIMGRQQHLAIIKANSWLQEDFPNIQTYLNDPVLMEPSVFSKLTKLILEILLFIPALIFEPALSRIHIRHTFKLPENHWSTSTTIANNKMLKLHSLDARKDIQTRFVETLTKIGVI